MGEVIENILVVNRLGLHILVINELSGAKDKGEEVVIIETPDAVRTGGLEAVGGLELAHEFKIGDEEPGDDGRVVLLPNEAKAGDAVEEGSEVGLVAGAIVDAEGVAEEVKEVG